MPDPPFSSGRPSGPRNGLRARRPSRTRRPRTPSPREPSWASAARPGLCAATACARRSSFRTPRRPSRWPGPPTARSRRPPSSVATAPPDETRRQRRRRLGIQRRITFRVILFVLLVAAVSVGAYFAIRWYAYDNWYLAVQNNEIVVKQGHPGGVLWFHPRVVDRTRTTTSQLLPTDVAQIRAGVQEPSLAGGEALRAQPRTTSTSACRTPSIPRTAHDHHRPPSPASPPARHSTAPRRDGGDDRHDAHRRPDRPPATTARPHHERIGTDGTAHPLARGGAGALLRAGHRPAGQHPVPPGQRAGQLPGQPAHRGDEVYDNERGTITASDGTVLAKSVKINSSSSTYNYERQYPYGPLYAGITGYDSLYFGTSGIEYQYNQYLQTHAQPPQNFSQLLFNKPPSRAGQRHPHRRPGPAGGGHGCPEDGSPRQPGRRGRGARPHDRGRAGPGLQSDVRPQRHLEPERPDRGGGPLRGPAPGFGEVRPPRSRWPPSRAFPRVDLQGDHQHRRVQPQAEPEQLQLSPGGVGHLPGLGRGATQERRRLRLRRDHDHHAAPVLRPRLRRARGPARRAHLDQAGPGLRVRARWLQDALRARPRPARRRPVDLLGPPARRPGLSGPERHRAVQRPVHPAAKAPWWRPASPTGVSS